MKRTLLSLIYLVTFLICFIGVKDFCQKQTKGFCLQKVISKNKSEEDINDSLSKEELKSVQTILSQPFYFFKRGLQCYVFISEDSKYVLKFFRWKQLEPSIWSSYLPSTWLKQEKDLKEIRKKHDFTSYKIAFEELQEETGTLFLHLSKTKGLNTPLCFFDPLHIRHTVEADQIEFILQKKTDLFLSYFEQHKKDPQKLELFLLQLLDLLEKRFIRQISDSDISLEYNMGVLNEKPVLFDIGNLTKKNTPISFKEFLKQESKLVLEWLKNNDPALAFFLENRIENKKEPFEEPIP